MRAVLSAVGLILTLSGCVGDFTSEHIESRYQQCLTNTDIHRPTLEKLCRDNRQFDYDYRLSLRRVFDKGGAGDRPIQMYRLN